MSVLSGEALLNERIGVINRLIAGKDDLKAVDLGPRVKALAARVDEVYSGMPALADSINACQVLEKQLYKKRTSILQVGEKLQYLTLMREELLSQFQMLDNIKRLEGAAEGITFHEDPEVQSRLGAINHALGALQAHLVSQTKEIDILLDTNESFVTLLSEKSVEWDSKLMRIEEQRPRKVEFDVPEAGEMESDDDLDLGGFGDDSDLVTEEESIERAREERRKMWRSKVSTNAQEVPESVKNEEPKAALQSLPSSQASAVAPVTLGSCEREDSGNYDMFSDSPTTGQLRVMAASRDTILQADREHLQSNWDDGEGYYIARPGEIIGGVYRTLGTLGKGVFSTVLECVPVHSHVIAGEELTGGSGLPCTSSSASKVAVKLIRNNDLMRKAAEKEISILKSLGGANEETYCIRLIANMEHHRHTALVFEWQRMNLREAIRKYGSRNGISSSAVRLYAKQLFCALSHMAMHRIVHADIKPDNILVGDDLKTVKICDFGSAFRENEPNAAEPTPYLVSRFYRAPEIIMGLPYDRRIDQWSVATCLYEAYCGSVMFAGVNNNDMLWRMMQAMGGFPVKMIRAHQRAYDRLELEAHFTDTQLAFKRYEMDAISQRPVCKIVQWTQATTVPALFPKDNDGHDEGDDEEDDEDRAGKQRFSHLLEDLLAKCLCLDPTKRLLLKECHRHKIFQL